VSEEIVVRSMEARDLPEVVEIERASSSTPWTGATFEGLLRRRDADLFVAEAEGRPVGFAVFWTVLDQGELGNIAVSPAWRRRGVGTRLLRSVIERARERGVRELFLEVRVTNHGAQRLYQRHGFRMVGRRPGYYTEPVEDALVMCRWLDDEPAGADSSEKVSGNGEVS
jgi:ribosomal-protein-alanine N-acetyltransferase